MDSKFGTSAEGVINVNFEEFDEEDEEELDHENDEAENENEVIGGIIFRVEDQRAE